MTMGVFVYEGTATEAILAVHLCPKLSSAWTSARAAIVDNAAVVSLGIPKLFCPYFTLFNYADTSVTDGNDAGDEKNAVLCRSPEPRDAAEDILTYLPFRSRTRTILPPRHTAQLARSLSQSSSCCRKRAHATQQASKSSFACFAQPPTDRQSTLESLPPRYPGSGRSVARSPALDLLDLHCGVVCLGRIGVHHQSYQPNLSRPLFHLLNQVFKADQTMQKVHQARFFKVCGLLFGFAMPLFPSTNVSMKRVEPARVSSRLPFQGLRARLMIQDTPGQDRHAQPQSNASLQASNLPSPGPSHLRSPPPVSQACDLSAIKRRITSQSCRYHLHVPSPSYTAEAGTFVCSLLPHLVLALIRQGKLEIPRYFSLEAGRNGPNGKVVRAAQAIPDGPILVIHPVPVSRWPCRRKVSISGLETMFFYFPLLSSIPGSSCWTQLSSYLVTPYIKESTPVRSSILAMPSLVHPR
ncbi:uncharacterized protein CLUP02_13438 [Colletotrichum lupini]|uniref:Uncharacterized protein n=1 Tax=Colletotrichum lupini TaxID=145971 RepID=A0A9Q8T439_9PEZI|nr:uncharacterized protein CLUP02_13438 [Colletotrichum lupini]UQC87917.1 hypothetical protein CLUP02_13438 [Colletotrichum lupini]